MAISYRFRQSVRTIPGVLEFQHGIKRDHGATMVDSKTALCVEGFPRSANSFSVNMISMFLELHRNRIANHTHSISNIRRAVRRGVPTIVMIRTPLDACRSLSRLRQGISLDDALCTYDDFYRRLEPLLHGVVLVPFDVAVNEPYTLLKTVATLIGMDIPEDHKTHFEKSQGLEHDLLQQIVGVSSETHPVESVSPQLEDLVARCNARYSMTLAAAPKVLTAIPEGEALRTTLSLEKSHLNNTSASPSRQLNANRQRRILNAATGLLFICILIVGSLKISRLADETLSDEFALGAMALFLPSVFSAYLAIRNDGSKGWQSVTAKWTLIAGVLVLVNSLLTAAIDL